MNIIGTSLLMYLEKCPLEKITVFSLYMMDEMDFASMNLIYIPTIFSVLK